MAVPQVQEEFPQVDDEGQINLADKADLDLKGFIEWLAKLRDLKIVDFGELTNQNAKIEFYGRNRVGLDEMFELVQAVLRTKELALVQTDIDNFYRVVPLERARVFAPESEPEKLDDVPKAEYVTAVFSLANASPDAVSTFITNLLYVGDTAGSAMSTIPGRNILIVTETARKLVRIHKLIKEMDQPIELAQPIFYKVVHLGANELATQLKEILSQTSKASNAAIRTNQPSQLQKGSDLSVSANERTNELILIGTTIQIRQALDLVEKLDVGLGLEVRTYEFQFVSAARIDGLVKQSLGKQEDDSLQRIYQSNVNTESNQLTVTAQKEIHKRVEQFRKQLDVSSQKENDQSPIEFYTLKNVKAVDILDTLQSIERRFRENRFGGSSRRNDRLDGFATRDGFQVNGANNFGAQGEGQFPGVPNQIIQDANGNPINPNNTFRNGNGFEGQQGLGPGQFPFQQAGGAFQQGENVIPGEAKITIHETTNTLIVVAEPAVQQLYASLIERLDVRRPQVLIEVNVVTLTDSDDFNLGIEIGGGDRNGSKRLFSFTSFGLSETSGTAGNLTLTPGLGFNGTLVDPDIADVVLRALATHKRSRVIAAPRILVNDNATGLLSSVAEVPFTSINAANTVSTTSFAGFAQAGTTISVTPQISDDDYLNLEFDVLINDFTGTGSAGVPPPRNTDQVTSDVSIPDGHTVIVGGLTRRRVSDDLQGLPLIEQLPILRDLTNRQIKGSEGQRLFVFIKPIILRDDKFKDLRFLSELERNRASLPDDFPSSGPVLIR